MKTLRNRSCLVACLLLCGCSPLMQGSLDTFKAAVQGVEPLQLTAADVAAVPYAQILVTTPSSEGVMAKLRQQGDLQYWVASGKQVLLMRNGLVVRTTGLQPALDGTRFDGQSPFKRGLHLVALRRSQRLLGTVGEQQAVGQVGQLTQALIWNQRVTIFHLPLDSDFPP